MTALKKLLSTLTFTAVLLSSGLLWADNSGYVNKWTILNSENSELPDSYINALLPDGSNGLWIGTSGNGFLHYRATGIWEKFDSPTAVDCLESDKDGGIWIGGISGLHHLKNDKTLETVSTGFKPSCFSWISDSALAVGTSENGIYIIENGIDIEPYSSELNQKIRSSRINTILPDGNNGLWVGTENRGIFHIKRNQEIDHFDSTSSKMQNDYVSSIVSDFEGGIWVGTKRGIYRVMADGTWVVFEFSLNTTGMLYMGEEGFIAGSWFSGVFSYTSDRKWINYNKSNSDLPSNTIITMAKTINGDIWVATDKHGIALMEQFSVVGITVQPDRIELSKGSTEANITVMLKLSDGSEEEAEKFDFRISDPQVATFKNNRIHAAGNGETLFTAVINDQEADLPVRVNFEELNIETEQKQVILEKGESYSPTVRNLYEDGFLSEVSDFTLSVISGEDVIDIKGKKISGKKKGTARVLLTSGNKTFEINVIIENELPLVLSHNKVIVGSGQRINIKIQSGKEPLKPSSGSVVDHIWTLTAPPSEGIHSFTLTDKYGNVAGLDVEVNNSLRIVSTGSGQIEQGGVITLSVKGGTPPYTWLTTGGKLSASETHDAAPVTYTAPIRAGVYTVSVYDDAGQSVDHIINSIIEPTTSPRRMYLTPGEEKAFTVLGGTPPYSISAAAGRVTENATENHTYTYTAPSVVGTYLVSVKDNKNRETKIRVNVRNSVLITPSKAYMDKGASQPFRIAGGVGEDAEINVRAIYGDVDIHPTNGELLYMAPNIVCNDRIILTDIDGSVFTAEVETLSENFRISPTNDKMFTDEKKLFRVVGNADGDVLWASSHGDISPAPSETGRISYTAPPVKCTADLSATDKATRETNATIEVVSHDIHITPSSLFMHPNDTVRLRVLGGSGDYRFVFTNGELIEIDEDLDGNTDHVEYTAPNRTGEYFITVYDSTGYHDVARATVCGGAQKSSPQTSRLYRIQFPNPWPNSSNQPIGVGEIIDGSGALNLTADFPTYTDTKGNPVPMNYYVAMKSDQHDILLFFGKNGIYTTDNIRPLYTREVQPVFMSVLNLPVIDTFPKGRWDVYAIAVNSENDPDSNLTLVQGSTPMEMWKFSFFVR